MRWHRAWSANSKQRNNLLNSTRSPQADHVVRTVLPRVELRTRCQAGDLRNRLNRLLGRSAPWLCDLFSTIDNAECAYSPGSAAHEDWPLAVATRQALD